MEVAPSADPQLALPSPDAWTEVRQQVRLAWPVVLGQVGLIAMNVEDLLIVGRLGEAATATVGLAHTWGFATLALGIGACAGIDPLVSQAWGAGDRQAAVRALLRGAVVVGVLCLPIMAVHWWSAPFLTAASQPPAIVPAAAAYCRVLAVGAPPFFAFQLLRQFLQGSGRMRAATWAIAVGNAANIGLAWTLVHGLGPIPGYGPIGSAWATVVVRWIMAFVLLAAAWPVIRADWPDLRGVFRPRVLAAVAALTLPVGVQVALEVWAFNVASFMAGWLGETATAAHTVGLSLASTSFMIPLGISAAAATRVGNLVGARAPWMRAARVAVALGASSMLASAFVYAMFPVALASLYNPDPAVVAAAAAVLPIAALFQVFDGTQAVGFGVLRGLGDTRLPMLANVIGYGLIGLPIGGLLAFGLGWGLPGVWLGLTVGLATVALMLLVRIAWMGRRQPA
ncbi:MAG: MATE family efflux transporter [Deltaproteobacteria bacterium]|nr:MATE family efflux transporter [Deltaproteobacteria bacterium]